MFIPGELIALLTFPGVILHEWAHKKFCDWSKVTVFKVKYFQFWNREAGFVLHEQPTKLSQTFWISVGPLLFNSILVIILGYIIVHIVPSTFKYYLLLWLAFSTGLHAFPSNPDAQNVLSDSKELLAKHRFRFWYYFAYPFFGLIWLANRLRVYWFDVFYTVFLIYFGMSI